MSADLFAEFGNGPSTRQPSNAARQQAPAPQAGSLIDGLDAFENATLAQSTPRHLSEPAPLSGTRKHSIQYDDFGEFELPQAGNNNDVLFDAALERFSDDGSDDWGEFETAEPSVGHINQYHAEKPAERQKTINKPAASALQSTRSPSGPSGSVDLLDSLDSLSFQNKPAASYHHSSDILVDDSPATKVGRIQNAKPKLPVQEEPLEEWGDFTDGPIEATQSSNSKVADHQGVPRQEEDSPQTLKPTAKPEATKMPKSMAQSPPAGHVRPTNIPPPSILLELFPQLFERLRQDGAEAKRNLQQREILESVSLSIINTLKTIARVIAGRTLRWKRDAILSQSMRIGPARSGKTGGMKLSTVNKNEDIKEQQETVDVINMWRDRAALFNSVIQAAGKRPVQVVLENTRVTTAMASQGAIKAPHACALCGLKRDERIPKIDENVEDSFGEWWTEHWGHTECRQFWEDNMGLLGQR
ncbi:hypothetical protein ASPVEDRAFT_43025 [Aspergillus versicolor CBS 583.65]|uniref:Uncharacterized protein n=1 Tax=Aspergillus versicolor CBS 583.65 TaxID=1036611 RepID=A0A1L9PQ12_ASPVE|nr:uncharacterized protein ASPVEDRAFT_43025 [Aspergillus versicolor CBS 583.65]OJJ03552.1 hypothetical protein ASPVEDRAFT_43025 [Aspergillus versicolor CBS 583.65]